MKIKSNIYIFFVLQYNTQYGTLQCLCSHWYAILSVYKDTTSWTTSLPLTPCLVGFVLFGPAPAPVV